MTTTADTLTGVHWFKSSYSNDANVNCVESAHLPGGAMAVRDSKIPDGPAFTLTGNAWATFINALADGGF
ncbi:DUF397 domain-containing protein [Streptomyces sp. NBC_01498]|uniref:DUF397 domain-containing protein n=1 Tax=Streptomyces sp. NBC_01498 TaxID=2975870 RepID=UPI002E7B3BDB|nr:DUF397 domain-containing protein [Streptomyces sp. NBC_01498]WTL26311.1 DUF397 domain-containing protein [Streptomyces sp. NBC_01498]